MFYCASAASRSFTALLLRGAEGHVRSPPTSPDKGRSCSRWVRRFALLRYGDTARLGALATVRTFAMLYSAAFCPPHFCDSRRSRVKYPQAETLFPRTFAMGCSHFCEACRSRTRTFAIPPSRGQLESSSRENRKSSNGHRPYRSLRLLNKLRKAEH